MQKEMSTWCCPCLSAAHSIVVQNKKIIIIRKEQQLLHHNSYGSMCYISADISELKCYALPGGGFVYSMWQHISLEELERVDIYILATADRNFCEKICKQLVKKNVATTKRVMHEDTRFSLFFYANDFPKPFLNQV